MINYSDSSVRFFPHWNKTDPHQVTGLMNLIFNIYLRKLSSENWVEIGSHLGESSTIFLGFPFVKKLHCVDIWYDPNYQTIFNERMKSFIAEGRCIPHKMESEAFSESFTDLIDVVYIDGNHEYEFVKKDIELFYSKLNQGGILCGHDYVSSHPGVIKAVDEFKYKQGIQESIKTFSDSSWLIQKPAWV